jgi:hypothetical protein
LHIAFVFQLNCRYTLQPFQSFADSLRHNAMTDSEQTVPTSSLVPCSDFSQPVIRKKRKRGPVACFSCRERKRKCDTRRPTCTNCLTGDWTCTWPEVDRRRTKSNKFSGEDVTDGQAVMSGGRQDKDGDDQNEPEDFVVREHLRDRRHSPATLTSVYDDNHAAQITITEPSTTQQVVAPNSHRPLAAALPQNLYGSTGFYLDSYDAASPVRPPSNGEMLNFTQLSGHSDVFDHSIEQEQSGLLSAAQE